MSKKEKNNSDYSARLRTEELKKAIFHPNAERQAVEENNDEYSIFYTMVGTKGAQKSKDGNFLLKQDNEDVFAKKQVFGLKTKYFVKINRQGHCYNPLGMYEIEKARGNPKLGGRDFKFREVSKVVFDFYLDFLKTKNNGFLLNAQRSMF